MYYHPMHPHFYPYRYPAPIYPYGNEPVYPPSQQEFQQEMDPTRNGWWSSYGNMNLQDYGSQPFVVNIEEATKGNNTFRTAVWTGDHLQVTVMSIKPGEDVGLEVHPNVDQFIRLEEGEGLVQMGETKDKVTFQRRVADDDAIMVPAGIWHNLINTGGEAIKLYTIYAPPEHPFGTVHQTKADAMEDHD